MCRQAWQGAREGGGVVVGSGAGAQANPTWAGRQGAGRCGGVGEAGKGEGTELEGCQAEPAAHPARARYVTHHEGMAGKGWRQEKGRGGGGVLSPHRQALSPGMVTSHTCTNGNTEHLPHPPFLLPEWGVVGRAGQACGSGNPNLSLVFVLFHPSFLHYAA